MSRSTYVLAALSVVLAIAAVFSPDSGLPGVGTRTTLAAPDNSITLQPFLTGFTNPVLITHAGDGSGRLFVVEKGGLIKIVVGGQVRPTPFLDLRPIVELAGGTTEQGLLGLAFHPNYENNGRFFVFYTAKAPTNQPPPPAPQNLGSNTLAEYHVDENDPEIANPTPVRILFSIPDRASNHNGGMMAFSPTDSPAHLYVATGDEGTGGALAQDMTSLYGKMLRLDVNTIPSGQAYGIPATNPFVGQAGKRPEIWAYGFRNPWRWSFDRQNGDLFIGDVGQGSWEEIDHMPSLLTGENGRNFGWNIREGAHCLTGSSCPTAAGMTDPILEYSHSQGCSVTGGYRYRGLANPALRGAYFYADFCSGRIWKGIQSGSSWTAVEALDTGHNIPAFGEDEVGELYVVTYGGSILRVGQMTTPPAANCTTRPKINVQTTRTASGTLSVTLTATNSATVTNNVLQAVAFNRITNSSVTIGAQTNQTSPFNAAVTGASPTAQFTVQRIQAGQPVHVDLRITDLCGPWNTFVGGGVGLP